MSKRRSRRPLVVASVVTVFVLVIVAGIIVGLQLVDEPVDLRPQSEAILRKLGAGEVDEVYASAAPRFRETSLEQNLERTAETMTRALGTFRRVTNVVDQEEIDSRQGKTARVLFELEFERARTRAELSFHRIDGRWRLLGIRVSIPESMAKDVEALERVTPRRAPDEVIALASGLADTLRFGDAADAGVSVPFATPESRTQAESLMAEQKKRLGELRRVLGVVFSTQSHSGERAQVAVILEFERGKADARFDFVSKGGRWLLQRSEIDGSPR